MNPKVGDEFLHSRVLNQDNTPMRYRITRVAQGLVYYKPVDGGHSQVCAADDLTRWVGSWQ